MLTLQQFCNVFDDQNDQRSNIIQLNFIETMKNKSYVESLLTCSRLCTSSQEVSEDDLTLFTATVGFIIKLADSKDGCSLLVQSSLFQKLYDAIYFRRFASLGRTEKMYENAKYKSFVEAVSTTFQLFNFILQRHAASMQVLHPISIYIRKNNAMIAHVLNLRDSNLAMLELAEIITRCLIAFSTKLMQIPEATGESTGNKLMSKLVNLLGEDMNATVQDCQTLISILGKVRCRFYSQILFITDNDFSIDFHVILDPRYGQSSNWSWLPAVKVAVDSTDYIKETVSISANNSLLNMRKVHAASGIVLNVLSFLRLITQESQSLVLQVKTLEVVAALFCAAGAALIDDASDENARRTKSAPAASQNCQDIAENCICIFYNLAVTSDKTVRAELHKLQCMQQVLNCSSYFPSQAFIGIVGRWIRERLEQTQ